MNMAIKTYPRQYGGDKCFAAKTQWGLTLMRQWFSDAVWVCPSVRRAFILLLSRRRGRRHAVIQRTNEVRT